jgi:uncharacterized membrane protein
MDKIIEIIAIVLMGIMFILAFVVIIWQGIYCFQYIDRPIIETPTMCVTR